MAHVVAVVMFLALLVMNAAWAFSSSPEGFRMDLTHTHSQDKFTPLQLHMRAIQQSKERMATLTVKKSSSSSNTTTDGLQSRVSYANSMYRMTLAIGTPPVAVMVSIDTENDLTWTQCQPCTQCPTQPFSLYDPSKSSTFSEIHCNTSLCQSLYQPTCAPDCMYSGYYGNPSYVEGVLATETLTFKTVDGQDALIPNIGFGCSHVNQGTDYYGVVGLNRAPLSLVSQLGAGKFSYCLTSYGDSNKTSPIFFGSSANLNDSSAMPLLYSPFPYYFLPLKGITVGEKLLPIPKEAFESDEDEFGKFWVDVNTPYGFLGAVAFELVKKEFSALLKLPIVDSLITNDELCFSLPSNSSVEVPKLIFHFEGVDLELPVENYMLHDPSTGFLCFTMLKGTSYFFFGSFQQQNMHVVYDLVQEKVSISPAQCDRL